MFERRENFSRSVLKTLKGLGISIGVALVFYLGNAAKLTSVHEHVKYLVTSVMYGFVIYLFIWMMYAVQRLVTRRVPGDMNMPLPTHLFLSMGGAAIGLYVALHIDAWYNDEKFTYGAWWQSLLVSLFIALMFQFYYSWKHSLQENMKLKAAKAEAELHALRNQMQPHFLFNSLNSLAALIDSDPATAGEATQKLADLYRLILDCSKNPLSPLEREVRIARLYLEIERIRFGRRLAIQLPVLSPAERDLLVPSLVLQTLVENAVKHGIAGSVEGGFVHVTVAREAGGLRIAVLNSGVPLADNRGSGGTGVRNTGERLSLAFGTAHGFSLSRTTDGLTSASFFVPEKS
jgi:hypothetical protein